MLSRRISCDNCPGSPPERHTAKKCDGTYLSKIHRLFLFSHRRCEGKPNQQSIGIEKSAHCLTPWFLLVPNKHSIPHRFKLRCGSLHIIHIELKPSVRHRQTIRPRAVAKARLRRLRERPRGELLCALQSIRVEIPAILLPEGDLEGLHVKPAAGVGIADDRAKTRDEENLDLSQSWHGISFSINESCSRGGHCRNEFASRHTSNDSSETEITS